MSQPLAASVLVVVFVLPFLWSSAVAAVRVAAVPAGQPVLPERTEQRLLLAMAAPALLGVALLCIRALTPAGAVLPSVPEISDALAASPGMAGAPPSTNTTEWISAGAFALLVVYAVGAALSALRLVMGEARARGIVREALRRRGEGEDGVLVTDRAVSPFASACGRIVLPRALFELLPPEQIAAVIRHERAHLERGDAAHYRRLAMCDALFWWNPFVRRQIERCRLCAELACDQAAVGGEMEAGRTYARSLLVLLTRLSDCSASRGAPRPFAIGAQGHLFRVQALLHGGAAARRPLGGGARAAILGMIAPLAAAQAACSDMRPAAPVFSVLPVEGRVSSPFGSRTDPWTGETRFHGGVDIAAAEGTPVLAPAGGVVKRVESGHPAYGLLVEIDHGGGAVSRYAQLSAIDVASGARLTAGDPIGKVGASGARATGPHLHLELFLHGEPVDPASRVPMPD